MFAHIAALAAARDEWEVRATTNDAAAREYAGTILALRERVRALESERDMYKRDFDAEIAGAAGLRMRCGAREGETFRMFVERLALDSRLLAAIRHRAGDTARLQEIAREAVENRKPSVYAAADAVACYVAGEDAGAPPPPPDGRPRGHRAVAGESAGEGAQEDTHPIR